MIYKAIAAAIMGNVLASAKKDIIDTAKADLLRAAKEDARKALVAHVAEKYTEEVHHNVSAYIEALGNSSAEIEFHGKPGEALILRAEQSVRELEAYIESQNPDGAIIKFLQTKYTQAGINIITGRLYAGHLVHKKAQGVYEIMNTMGYASAVDKRKPWLTSPDTYAGIESLVVKAAQEIFELSFDGLDLSSEMALLTTSRDIQPQLEKLTDEQLLAMTRDQLKELAGTKRNLAKKELVAKIRANQKT